MTEALFREDAYLRECEARVVSSGPEGVLLPPALQGTFTPDLRRSDDRLIGNLTLRL